ncbi:hypothetical protein ACFL21_02200, partial [Patescibacteria group bacterium]
ISESVKRAVPLVLLLAATSFAASACVEGDDSTDALVGRGDVKNSATGAANLGEESETLNETVQLMEFDFDTSEFYAMLDITDHNYVNASLTFSDASGNSPEDMVTQNFTVTPDNNEIHKPGSTISEDAVHALLEVYDEEGSVVARFARDKSEATRPPGR